MNKSAGYTNRKGAEIIKAVFFSADNIYERFDNKVYRQVVVTFPIVTNSTPFNIRIVPILS